MYKNIMRKKAIYIMGTLCLMLSVFGLGKMEVKAVSFPDINVSFDATDESVIVDSIPANSPDGLVEYQLEGYLNYEKERVTTF